MKIDLTCPVELWQSAMPAEDVSECTFVLNNLSHKVVVSLSSDAELLRSGQPAAVPPVRADAGPEGRPGRAVQCDDGAQRVEERQGSGSHHRKSLV